MPFIFPTGDSIDFITFRVNTENDWLKEPVYPDLHKFLYFGLLLIILASTHPFIGAVIDGITFNLLYFMNSNYMAVLVLLFHGM